jgi:hypothetical protein
MKSLKKLMKENQTHQSVSAQNVEATALFRQVSVATGIALLAATGATKASSDYGPAIWQPACNANYYTSGNGHLFHVIHDMEGFYGGVVSTFTSCNYTAASVHYAVNSGSGTSGSVSTDGGATWHTATDSDGKPAGEITQMISEANYAWHAYCWNRYSTGTEHEGFVSNPAWYTEAQYVASAALTKHICEKFGFAKDRNHIVGHDAKSSAAWVAWAGPNFGIDATCNSHTDPGPYWDWNHYMALVNGSGGGASPLRIDTFVKGTDGGIWQKFYDGSTGWSANWFNLGASGTLTSDIGACSWGANRIDMFYRRSDNACWHTFFDGTWRVNWDSLGGSLTGKPAAASWGSGHIDVFVKGTDNQLYRNAYSGTWSGWACPITGTLASDPAAVSWGPNRIDVFARNANNQLIHAFYNTGSWSGWETFTGGYLQGAPAAASRGSGRLDVFIRGTDNQLYHKWYDAGIGWQPGGLAGAWELQGGPLTSDPAAVSDSPNRVHAFVRGGDNGMWHRWYDSGQWGGFEALGGGLTGAPAACSWTHP